MDLNDELQGMDFDLDDILKEFGGSPEEAPAEEPKAPESVPAPAEEKPQEAMPALEVSEEVAAPAASEEAEEAPAEPQPMDDTMADLGAALTEALEASAAQEEPTRVLPELPEELKPEAEAGEEPTVRFQAMEDLIAEAEEAEKAQEKEQERAVSPPIQFTSPRSRLRELKKKLVAGPEKRYYILSEAGIGKLQAAILVSALVVLVCAGITTLFVLDMVPENRLRLVIFSQVLAMLVAALMGCQLMLDAIIDIFKGKFTVNTLLTIAFGVCIADTVNCLEELRVPCCAAFCLSMTMALWARYEKHTTEMAQMDTMRKAVRLTGIVKKGEYHQGMAGLLRTEGEVEDFMDVYNKTSGPEKLQNFYALLSLLLCIGIAAVAFLKSGASMAVQILSTSLLVAVPATFFVSITRPAAILEQRLHMVGTVLCGWKGVKELGGKAIFPLDDMDLFPQGCTKLNGVKFYGDRTPDEVVSYTTSLIYENGGGLVPVFQQLLASREGEAHSVENFRSYGGGGIGGEVRGEPVLMGDMNFMQDMGVEIPEGTMVNQAIYAAIDGQLSAVFAMSYAKMRSAAAGLVTLSSYRRLSPVMVGSDFMVTEEFIQAKFGVKTKRIAFPDWETRRMLKNTPVPEGTVLAMTTRQELVSAAYAVTGARALATATRLGVAIHLVGGILGMLMMLVLAVLGNTELLVPTNVLLYQLVWAVPGLLVTEWARTV